MTTKLDEKKLEKMSRKNDVDEKEQEVNDVKKRAAVLQKDLSTIQKQATSLETSLEQKKSERHLLLQACKVSSFCIFFLESGWYWESGECFFKGFPKWCRN